MGQMGNNSYIIVGYHDKVSENSELSIILFQIRNLCLLHMLFLNSLSAMDGHDHPLKN
jgi:hypothetical protein